MDFSWATISFIDIGIFSLSIIAVATGWLVRKHADKRYNALQQEHVALQEAFSNFQSTADQRYNALLTQHNTLQEAHNTLLTQHNTLQEAHNTLLTQHNTLQQEHEALKEENATLRSAVNALTTEQKALQSAHDHLSGRHDELVERVMPVFEILAREKLMEINARNEN